MSGFWLSLLLFFPFYVFTLVNENNIFGLAFPFLAFASRLRRRHLFSSFISAWLVHHWVINNETKDVCFGRTRVLETIDWLKYDWLIFGAQCTIHYKIEKSKLFALTFPEHLTTTLHILPWSGVKGSYQINSEGENKVLSLHFICYFIMLFIVAQKHTLVIARNLSILSILQNYSFGCLTLNTSFPAYSVHAATGVLSVVP